jgi:hypothetical protein
MFRSNFVFLLFLLTLSPCITTAGEIDWEKASFGLTATYQIPYGDFGAYWNNGYGLGGFVRYEALDRLYLMATSTAGYFTPARNAGDGPMPHIWTVTLTGSLQYELFMTRRTSGYVGIGGDNVTFIFRGSPAERLGTNYIESEVALHAEAGLRFRIKRLPDFDIFTRYSSIFSFPEQIPIWVSGVYLYMW